jgi:hypothetical protein
MIATLRNRFRLYPKRAASIPVRMRHPGRFRVIDRVAADGRTYLSYLSLWDPVQRVEHLEKTAAPGIFIEAGCALGGSAVVIASVKNPQRVFRVYDTFGLIPPPSIKDGEDVLSRYENIRCGRAVGLGGDTYYGYQEDLLGQVRDSFARYGYPVDRNSIELVQGFFEDTLAGDEPVAFAHIDCDWYESVTTCLSRIVPRLIPGGILVLDDYDHWSGCQHAVDDFFAQRRQEFTFEHRLAMHIVRLS